MQSTNFQTPTAAGALPQLCYAAHKLNNYSKGHVSDGCMLFCKPVAGPENWPIFNPVRATDSQLDSPTHASARQTGESVTAQRNRAITHMGSSPRRVHHKGGLTAESAAILVAVAWAATLAAA